MLNRLVSLLLLLLPNWTQAQTDFICNERELSEKSWIVPSRKVSKLEIWHNPPLAYHPFRLFTDVFLELNITDSEAFQMYWGPNCSTVKNQHDQDHRLFAFLKSAQIFRTNNLNPFNDSYIGVSTQEPYAIGIKILEVNYARAALFVGGILLFVFASLLVRNVLFYYTSGCTVGLVASVLLVAIIVYRIAPKKTIGIPILLGGWSVSGWMFYYGWTNFTSILNEYYQFVAAYFGVWIIGSLAYCYRRGPPTDVRSHNLMQWGMQAIACALLYFSSQIPEISLGVIFFLVFGSYSYRIIFAPFKFMFKMYSVIRNRFCPPKIRFLTQKEYEEQSRETTERELLKLREYCRSPDTNWRKLTRNVRDSKKLSRFADGLDDHVSEEESTLHKYADERLDQTEDDYLDEDRSSEYDGWENELRNRRSASVMINRRVQKEQRARIMNRVPATTSRLPRPLSHRLRSEDRRQTKPVDDFEDEEEYIKQMQRKQKRPVDDFEDEEEYIKQLQRKQKSASSRFYTREMSYMDSDDEDIIQEGDLIPSGIDY